MSNFSLSDSLPLRLGLRYRFGPHVPVLLPEAQAEGVDRLLRRNCGGARRFPFDWNDHRVVRILFALLRLFPRGNQFPATSTGARVVLEHARREQSDGQVGGRLEPNEGMKVKGDEAVRDGRSD